MVGLAVAGGDGGQRGHPVLVAAGLGGQRGQDAAGERGQGVLQVLQQDAPGDAVDDQVMDGDQQVRGRGRRAPVVHQHGPYVDALERVEAALGVLQGAVEVGLLGDVPLPQDLLRRVRGEGLGGDHQTGGGIGGAGGVGVGGEPGGQRRVRGDHGLEGQAQGRGVDGAAQFEQHRLVPLVQVGPDVPEEPGLDRGERGGPPGGHGGGAGRSLPVPP